MSKGLRIETQGIGDTGGQVYHRGLKPPRQRGQQGFQAAPRGGKQITVHLEEAKTVRRVFNLRRSGPTRYAIAGRLNAEGILTREGKRWAHTQVGRIRGRGPIYRSRIYRYAGIESAEAQQPAILGTAP